MDTRFIIFHRCHIIMWDLKHETLCGTVFIPVRCAHSNSDRMQSIPVKSWDEMAYLRPCCFWTSIREWKYVSLHLNESLQDISWFIELMKNVLSLFEIQNLLNLYLEKIQITKKVKALGATYTHNNALMLLLSHFNCEANKKGAVTKQAYGPYGHFSAGTLFSWHSQDLQFRIIFFGRLETSCLRDIFEERFIV